MRNLVAVFLLALLTACTLTANPDASGDARIEVLSFNIRYGTADDGPNAWPRREALVYDVIRTQDADFLGLQEALRFQIDGIREAVPGYAEIGAGREDGREAGEYSAILARDRNAQPGSRCGRRARRR
jgi:endonuclease/exonuclease/phosphatase family metal-dependent hydrolase